MTVFTIRYGVHTSSKVKIQLINLAISDCLFAFSYPVYCCTIFLVRNWSIGLTSCCIYVFVCKVMVSASPLCNAAICLERLVIIYFPLRAKQYRRSHKLMVVALIWFCSCLLAVDNVIYVQMSFEIEGTIYCEVGEYHHEEDSYLMGPSWVVPIIELLLPFTTVLVSYVLVCVRFCVRRRSALVKGVSRRREKGIDKLMMMMAVDALTSVLPYLLFYLYLYLLSQDEQLGDVIDQDVPEALYVTSAYSMPVIYLLFNPYFRKDLRLLFQRMRCKKVKEVLGNQSKETRVPTIEENIA
ncbi:somatostatin receptor type 1-like [Watersipora subatra]|uniref:somatostatin receptor type 1-like n=1 Tax=Watersipora subatra TaxID=2589382 RepID=UPI00355BBB62